MTHTTNRRLPPTIQKKVFVADDVIIGIRHQANIAHTVCHHPIDIARLASAARPLVNGTYSLGDPLRMLDVKGA